ncbi:MAG: TonB-dependent receptor family protein [Prevotellaceae bacterium]|jgi:hypothetical protein|nr:TonB-dependent receptor family protein [Prevotellaceae bacterium]
MKSLFLPLIFVLISAVSSAQVSISGRVLDADKNPLERAAVSLLRLGDSVAVTGGLTDKSGRFTLSAVAGKYLVRASFIGFSDAIVSVDASKSLTISEAFVLNESGLTLDSALVVARALEMIVRGDTVEYNATLFKTLPSAVVEDLLKKLPGAEVDENGVIKINGKEVKKILVDKKEFFGDDPKMASRNLPAEMVDKVQVWDKKSDMAELTGFDDGEEETVINLSIKPGMKKGFFGNVSAGAGNKDRYDAGFTMNYMRNSSQFTLLGGSNNVNNDRFSDQASASFANSGQGRMSFGGRNGIMQSNSGGFNFAAEVSPKFKIGGNVMYGNTNRDVESQSYTQNYISSGDQFQTGLSAGSNKSVNASGSLRMEWSPSERTRIIFTPNIRRTANNNQQASGYLTTRENPEDSINWGHSRYVSESAGLNMNGSLNVSHKFGKKGRTLSLGISGGMNNQNTEGMNYSQTDYKKKASVITDQTYDTRNEGFNYRINLSYVEPLGRNNFLQLSYNRRSNYSEQKRLTSKNDGAGNYTVPDTSSTKKLENDFLNHELRINFQMMREKYNFTLGLALQPSNSESRTIQLDTSSVVRNRVLNFAPLVQFVYRYDRQTNLRVNYNGRVNQPSATQLSSIRDESNPLNISYGNPDLNPSFSNNFNARFQKTDRARGNTISLNSTVAFTLNDIVRYSLVDSVGKRESTYKNINGNWQTSTRFQINKQFTETKFSINSSSNFAYSADNGFVNGIKNTAGNLTLGQNLGVSYRSELFDLSLRGNVRYNRTKNSLETQSNTNREVFDYGSSMNTTVYLPWDFSFESDVNYSANAGYSDGYKLNEWLWNATIQKQLFKKKNATIRFRMYDILKQRSNISRSAGAQSLRYTSTNILGPYFIVHFIYRLQSFGGNNRGNRRTPAVRNLDGFEGETEGESGVRERRTINPEGRTESRGNRARF